MYNAKCQMLRNVCESIWAGNAPNVLALISKRLNGSRTNAKTVGVVGIDTIIPTFRLSVTKSD